MRGRALAASFLALLVGCGKPPPETAAPGESAVVEAAETSAGPVEPSVSEPRLETAAADEAATAAMLGELTQMVRRYGMEHQKVPQSLEDLVTAGYISRLPSAPAGRRFVISRALEVQLTD